MRIATILFALALSVTAVQAGNGNGNGHAYGQENGNNGNGNGQGNNGNGNGNGGSNGNTNNGNGNTGGTDGNATGNGQTSSSVYSPEGLVTSGADQNIALDAVNSGQALPLEKIEPAAVQQWGGRVIDAKLLRVRGTLIYRLTLISESGVSRRVYYDARTGASVAGR